MIANGKIGKNKIGRHDFGTVSIPFSVQSVQDSTQLGYVLHSSNRNFRDSGVGL